jgi:hypothetical protein
LARVCLAMERLIWRAQKASTADVVGSAAVNYIERREVGGETNEKPFNASQKAKTMEKYAEVWKSIVAYVWRTHGLDVAYEADPSGGSADGESESESAGEEGDGDRDGNRGAGAGASVGKEDEGIRDKRPPYRLTEYQVAALERVRAEAGRGEGRASSVVGGSGDAAGADADSGDDSDGGDSEEGGDDDTQALERCVLGFFIALLDHDVGDNEFQNALYSALAVLGIREGHDWKSALVYTPLLSAVVIVARMLVLYKAKQAREAEMERIRYVCGVGESEA